MAVWNYGAHLREERKRSGRPPSGICFRITDIVLFFPEQALHGLFLRVHIGFHLRWKGVDYGKRRQCATGVQKNSGN